MEVIPRGTSAAPLQNPRRQAASHPGSRRRCQATRRHARSSRQATRHRPPAKTTSAASGTKPRSGTKLRPITSREEEDRPIRRKKVLPAVFLPMEFLAPVFRLELSTLTKCQI